VLHCWWKRAGQWICWPRPEGTLGVPDCLVLWELPWWCTEDQWRSKDQILAKRLWGSKNSYLFDGKGQRLWKDKVKALLASMVQDLKWRHQPDTWLYEVQLDSTTARVWRHTRGGRRGRTEGWIAVFDWKDLLCWREEWSRWRSISWCRLIRSEMDLREVEQVY